MTKNAIKTTWQTCLGVLLEFYPVERGNCFSVECEDHSHYRIVNFALENLEEAIRRGITWPIKIKPLKDLDGEETGVAIIHDERIPDNWYDDCWCEVCCPVGLLPVPQRERHERQIARGERVVMEKSICITPSMAPKLPDPKEKDFPPRVLYYGGGGITGLTNTKKDK